MGLIKTYSKSFISCFILLLLFQTNLQSQSLNNEFRRQYHWFVGVGGGPTQTSISNDVMSVLSGTEMTKKNSFCISVDAGYFFSKYFAISTGIGLSPYFTQLSLDTYSNSLDTIDSENESYERRISGNNIEETQKIYFLEIPVILSFQYPFSKAIGFYVQSGINLAIPVSKKYSSSGTYSYSGYYPAYNVLLEDIPYEGFKSNVENDISGELKVKTINPELVASGGFYFCTEKKYQISAGFFYKKILSDISAYSPVESFQLSTHENQVRSFMEGSEKTTASSMGIMISLRYYIK
ncbi:MAG: hypothetical protein E4G94_03295 [ANME-2 cluster archaeon]|nr:MAG: hypothetical protein E4G94_03295 [ANME-2 cluster archaeon]